MVMTIGHDPTGMSHAEIARVLSMRRPDGTLLDETETPIIRALHGEPVIGERLLITDCDRHVMIVLISAAPLLEQERPWGVVSIWHDISKRERLLEEVQQLQEQQQDMLRIVSHDLRAPLSVILGHAQLTREYLIETQQDGALRASVDSILIGTQQLNAMIQDLTDAIRQEGRQLRLEAENIDLHPFLAAAVQQLATTMDSSRIHLEVPADLPAVAADPNRLVCIFTNLLSNAMKYSDPGTPVFVRARQTDGEVEVAVSDQGPGISPDDLPYLFERYFRTKRQRKTEGIGLGLYITRMLVEAHGGKIWVESEMGKGSTFYFTSRSRGPARNRDWGWGM